MTALAKFVILRITNNVMMIFIVICSLFLASCSHNVCIPSQNSLIISSNGKSQSCVNTDRFDDENNIKLNKHFTEIFSAISTARNKNFCNSACEQVEINKILIFIHGGLNSLKSSQERSKIISKIMKDGYYPIFINWDADLPDSFREDLFFIRQGKVEPAKGIITFPFKFASELGGSLIESPLSIYNQAEHDIKGNVFMPQPYEKECQNTSANDHLDNEHDRYNAINCALNNNSKYNAPSLFRVGNVDGRRFCIGRESSAPEWSARRDERPV